VKTITTPFPSQTVHPGGSGELWVAGSTRVERIPPTGAGDPDDCDVTEPELTIAGFEDDSITIAELERDGVVLHVNEPSILYIDLTFTDDGEPGNFGTIDEQRVLTKPGEVRVDVPPDFIRRARDHLANGKKPTLMSLTSARDASGNDGYGEEGPGMSAYVTD
jgi:hypothetical protein